MSKNENKPNSIIGTALAILVLIVGLGIYAFTGQDVLGVLTTPTPAAPASAPTASGNVELLTLPNANGGRKGFWEVWFTEPVNTRDRSQWVDGADVALAEDIDAVRSTLDIAAFEWNNEVLTEAVLRAHDRGVQVRMVVDSEHTFDDDDSTIFELEAVGIPIVIDDRSALMHNKFMIMDSITVWFGSMNYTQNDVYRNDNNVISLRSRRAVQAYQAEFNEMYIDKEFGTTSPTGNGASFTQDGIPVEIWFAAEDPVVNEILTEIDNADSEIRFMTFSFTRDDLGLALVAASERGVNIQGVFETTGSETRFSEMGRLFCAGVDVRQDGNPGVLHHKVFVIDGETVITGSFNFSDNAVESNDENFAIIRDPDLASLYLREFARIQSIASAPVAGEDVTCN